MEHKFIANQKVVISNCMNIINVLIKQSGSTPGAIVIKKLVNNQYYLIQAKIQNKTSGTIKTIISNRSSSMYLDKYHIKSNRMGNISFKFKCTQTDNYKVGFLANDFKINEHFKILNFRIVNITDNDQEYDITIPYRKVSQSNIIKNKGSNVSLSSRPRSKSRSKSRSVSEPKKKTNIKIIPYNSVLAKRDSINTVSLLFNINKIENVDNAIKILERIQYNNKFCLLYLENNNLKSIEPNYKNVRIVNNSYEIYRSCPTIFCANLDPTIEYARKIDNSQIFNKINLKYPNIFLCDVSNNEVDLVRNKKCLDRHRIVYDVINDIDKALLGNILYDIVSNNEDIKKKIVAKIIEQNINSQSNIEDFKDYVSNVEISIKEYIGEIIKFIDTKTSYLIKLLHMAIQKNMDSFLFIDSSSFMTKSFTYFVKNNCFNISNYHIIFFDGEKQEKQSKTSLIKVYDNNDSCAFAVSKIIFSKIVELIFDKISFSDILVNVQSLNLSYTTHIDLFVRKDYNKAIFNFRNIHISPLNYYIDKIFVINMSKDRDKKSFMMKKLGNHNIMFDFVEGINGREKPYINRYNAYKRRNLSHPLEKRRKMKLITSPGAWGYLESWKKILELSIENGYKSILVFDDDVIFKNDFNIKIKNFLDQINWETWKVIYFGCSQYNWNKVNIKLAAKRTYYNPVAPPDGSFAVALNSTVFREVLAKVNQFYIAFDSGPLASISSKYPNDVYISYPNLVIADVTKSDIGKNRNFYEHSKKMRWNLPLYKLDTLKLKVSVIVPIYNAQKNISTVIENLLSQTYKNLEIILVNDCSTDKSEVICKKYERMHSNIIYLRTKKNGGCYVARNLGIKNATGDIIAFQDSDDVSLSYRIEKQLATMILNGFDICFCNIYRSNMSKLVNDDSVLLENCKNEKGSKTAFTLGIATSLINKELFKKYGLYREDSRHSSDLEFIERCYCYMTNTDPNSIEHMHTLINTKQKYFDQVYISLDDVMYISQRMNKTNISNQFNKSLRSKYMEQWKKDIKNRSVLKSVPKL